MEDLVLQNNIDSQVLELEESIRSKVDVPQLSQKMSDILSVLSDEQRLEYFSHRYSKQLEESFESFFIFDLGDQYEGEKLTQIIAAVFIPNVHPPIYRKTLKVKNVKNDNA